ncbi:ABC transporter substrate-binding protein [Paenibacillus qinlingensis]|uniref:ABC transporter substrate-binding protein n=1 Tax=Paenibacillus qinlingensis TaxID=1837343 RepID=UPI001565F891|nr:AraC family transcriptional regulator [Paenibacillus qinlingensis]NQX59109.1 AraC family transcriptional regulator [Paenibacillus qinlingensis]
MEDLEIWQSVEALGRMRAQAAFQELLCRILEDGQAPNTEGDSNLSVKRTMDYLEQFSHLPMTIEELAEMAGMSRYYYMRSFKQLNGVSVMDYLSELRINQAKVLMENPRMKLRDIAKQVGYQDEYYFIRKFKQQVGIPPATYMKNKQRKVAAYSFPNIGQLLALKIVPFAAPMDHYWTDMYRRKYQYDIVTPLSHDYDFNRQALQASKPDYILGIDHFIPAEEQEKLQEVAPAFFVPWLSNDWRTHLRLIAQFLGIEDVAEIWLEDYARKVAKVREHVNDVFKDDTVLIVQISEEHIYVYGERSIASVLYQDLGIKIPKGIGASTSHTLVTLEELADCDAERLMVMFTNGNSTQENWERLKKNNAWNELKAVRNQAVTCISPWLWFEYSAYTQERFLKEVATIMKA